MSSWKNARALQLLGCTAAIYVTYLYYGIVQERLTSTEYGQEKEQFTFTFGLLWLQCAANAVLAKAVLVLLGQQKTIGPSAQRSYATASFFYTGAMFTSNAALAWVSYPTQVLAKSCKAVPIMIFGSLVNHTAYTWHQYVMVAMVSSGIAVFMLQGNIGTRHVQAPGTFSGYGQLLLLLSLLFDGLTGSAQDRIKSTLHATTHQLMFYMNLWGMLFLAVGLTFTSELPPMIEFCRRHPEALSDMAAFAAMSAIGQNFIFYAIVTFGPLVVSIITTTRKFFTIVISVVLFGHSLTSGQWFGVALVLGGLCIDMWFGYWAKVTQQWLTSTGQKLDPEPLLAVVVPKADESVAK